jgi:hypothetical protein
MLVVVAVLAINSIALFLIWAKSEREILHIGYKVKLLQVQLMDRILVNQEGKKLGLLRKNPKEWLEPLKEMINNDPTLSSLLRNVAIRTDDPSKYLIYCNPVDDSPEAYELFTLTFSGDECTAISRHALCPW